EIGGTVQGTDYDFVGVSGNASLAGTLDVSLLNSYTPTPGQEFTVLTASNVIDNGLVLGGSAASLFNLLVGPSSVVLKVAQPGDFNQDDAVNAGDYVMWRKTDDTQPGYVTWRSNYGQPPGSGAAIIADAAVPEP